MKNNLHIIFAILFIAILAGACNHSRNITVLKRHYSKGNYVSISKNQKPYVYQAPAKKQELTVRGPIEKKAIQAFDENEEQGVVSSSEASQSVFGLKKTRTLSSAKLFENSEESASTEATPKVKRFNHFSAKRNILQSQKNSDNDGARSLFWLVITILLIIWLIAIVSGGWGLGGLVNILLLIALILFILWLLRLI